MTLNPNYDASPAVKAIEKKYFKRTSMPKTEAIMRERMIKMQLELLELYREDHKKDPETFARAERTKRALRRELDGL